MFDRTLLLAAAMGALALLAAHYFPWHRVWGRPLPAPWTYIIGMSLLGVAFTVVCAEWGNWQALWAAFVIVLAGGGAVLLAYGIDSLLNLRAERNDWKDKATVYAKDR